MFHINLVVPVLIMSLTGLVLSSSYITDTHKSLPLTRNESQEIAEKFLLKCKTFKFDGIADSIKLSVTKVMPVPESWEFTFAFDCSNIGYGNRADEVLIPVITHHRIIVLIEKGEIKTAIIDNTWDEIHHKSL